MDGIGRGRQAECSLWTKPALSFPKNSNLLCGLARIKQVCSCLIIVQRETKRVHAALAVHLSSCSNRRTVNMRRQVPPPVFLLRTLSSPRLSHQIHCWEDDFLRLFRGGEDNPCVCTPGTSILRGSSPLPGKCLALSDGN